MNTTKQYEKDKKTITTWINSETKGAANCSLIVTAVTNHTLLLDALKCFIHCADGCQNGTPKYLQIAVEKAKVAIKAAENNQ